MERHEKETISQSLRCTAETLRILSDLSKSSQGKQDNATGISVEISGRLLSSADRIDMMAMKLVA